MDLARDAALSALARRLRLTRPLAFIDLETTGVSVEHDRIVELAVVKVLPGGDVVRLSSLVHPGMSVPRGASDVHGLTDEHLADAPRFASLAAEVARFLDGCDIGGFNVGKFDLRLLAAELGRCGAAHSLATARIVDVMTIFHRHERRDLQAAVRFYAARDHRGHRAGEDVDATIDVLIAQLDRYPALPSTLDELADWCSGRQSDWLTSDGRIAWRDGAARITFGKHAGKSLQNLTTDEPGYLRWILDKDFPDDLKQVVENALKGTLPAPLP